MVLPPSMQGSLPAGWLASTGRELNPLDRNEGFQITSSSSLPGLFLLFLAQRPKTCTSADSALLPPRWTHIGSSFQVHQNQSLAPGLRAQVTGMRVWATAMVSSAATAASEIEG
jgi:hypothetical protein